MKNNTVEVGVSIDNQKIREISEKISELLQKIQELKTEATELSSYISNIKLEIEI